MTGASRPPRQADRATLLRSRARGAKRVRAMEPGSPAGGGRWPERTRKLGDDHASNPPLHPEIEAFARWFCDWWLRRGRQSADEER